MALWPCGLTPCEETFSYPKSQLTYCGSIIVQMYDNDSFLNLINLISHLKLPENVFSTMIKDEQTELKNVFLKELIINIIIDSAF